MLRFCCLVCINFLHFFNSGQCIFQQHITFNSFIEVNPSITQAALKKTQDEGRGSLAECILSCVHKRQCKGLLFRETTACNNTCIHLLDGTLNIALDSWNNYRWFCMDSSRLMTESGSVPCWLTANNAIPRDLILYFPMESNVSGLVLGSTPGNAQFITGGLRGNAFYNPTTGAEKSYYRLGPFPTTDYCFQVGLQPGGGGVLTPEKDGQAYFGPKS